LKNVLAKLPLALIFLVAIAFSLKSLREPDLWWQIRTGEWILQNHQIPKQDVFSYTYAGTPWVNIKWGFEVVAALITKTCGAECIFLLQALVSCLIVYFLMKGAKAFSSVTSFQNPFVLLGLLLSVTACEYRLIGRPEMTSHLLTAVFLFMLLRNRAQPDKQIFWLVPLQIFWANFHEAFAIGLVLIGLFFIGDWITYLLGRKEKNAEASVPKQISLLLLLGIMGIVVNPNGVELLTRPLNILGQVYENKYTTELLSFTSPDYWQWNTYLTLAFIIIGIVGTFIYYRSLKTKQSKWQLFIKQFGLGYLLTLLAFTYLAATAYRNIIFLVLVFFPVLAFGANAWYNHFAVLEKFRKHKLVSLSVLTVVLYVLIVSNRYYTITNSRDKFGLEVRENFNPVNAAQFVEANKLQGRCFSDYLTSSYMLWKLQPNFKTFIDLRDLDVFPSSFFSTFAEAVTFPDAFEQLDSTYQFKYVVLYRPQFTALHKYLYNSSNYKLAYLDAVAAVYIKNADSTIEFKPVIHPSSAGGHTALSLLNFVFNPLLKYGEPEYVNNNYIKASYYASVADYNKAQQYADSCLQGEEPYKGYEMLGEVYYNKAMLPDNIIAKDSLLNIAGSYYQQAIHLNAGFTASYMGIGANYYQQQNFTAALENFEKAIALDKTNLNAYLFAAECSKYFVNKNAEGYTEKTIALYHKADKLNPDNPTIMLNLGFLYFRLNNCSKASYYLKKVVNFEGLSEQERNSAKECIAKCGNQ